ncbi:MAG: metal-dependent hydrolase, partial [Candidatus Methanoperedens sp.]|nr:metal-dependent hydrolase [Candidatus Methanoperedens sp.]
TAFVLGGIAPDFDVFLVWINSFYPTFFLIVHRGITHTLFFGFFTALAVLYLATREKVRSRVQKFISFETSFSKRTAVFAYAGVLVHLFLDYVTTRGVPVFYPFETARYSAEVFFYTDIYLTILSLIFIILLYKKYVQKEAATKILIIFLVVFAVLGALRLTEKNSAENAIQDPGIKLYPTMSPFDWYAVGLKWRAYAVAVNASFDNGSWLIEYYDPLQRKMLRGTFFAFRRAVADFGSVKVRVEKEKAFVY